MHKMSFIFLSLLIFFLTKVISKTLALKEKKKKSHWNIPVSKNGSKKFDPG